MIPAWIEFLLYLGLFWAVVVVAVLLLARAGRQTHMADSPLLAAPPARRITKLRAVDAAHLNDESVLVVDPDAYEHRKVRLGDIRCRSCGGPMVWKL